MDSEEMADAEPSELVEHMLKNLDEARNELEDLRLMSNRRGLNQDRLRADEVGARARPAQKAFTESATTFAYLRDSDAMNYDGEVHDIAAPLGSDIAVERNENGTIEVTNRDFYDEDQHMELDHENAVALALGLLQATSSK